MSGAAEGGLGAGNGEDEPNQPEAGAEPKAGERPQEKPNAKHKVEKTEEPEVETQMK